MSSSAKILTVALAVAASTQALPNPNPAAEVGAPLQARGFDVAATEMVRRDLADDTITFAKRDEEAIHLAKRGNGKYRANFVALLIFRWWMRHFLNTRLGAIKQAWCKYILTLFLSSVPIRSCTLNPRRSRHLSSRAGTNT